MDHHVTMEKVVKGLDVTFVPGSQPAGNKGRSLLHASIVSRCGLDGASKSTSRSEGYTLVDTNHPDSGMTG